MGLPFLFSHQPFAQVSRKGVVFFALVFDKTGHVQNAQLHFLGGFYSSNTWQCFPCHCGLYMHMLSSGHTELPNDNFGAGISLLLWWMSHCKWKHLWPLCCWKCVSMAAIARMLGCLWLSLGKGRLPSVPSFHLPFRRKCSGSWILLAPRYHAKELSVEFIAILIFSHMMWNILIYFKLCYWDENCNKETEIWKSWSHLLSFG